MALNSKYLMFFYGLFVIIFSRKRETMKKYIPNILTISRILATPLILYFGIQKQFLLLIVIGGLIAFTDFLDGKLARLWKVKSELGAKLDAIADKCFALSLLAILIYYNHYFFYVLVLEGLISLFNIYVFYKYKVVQSLMIGKIKTWVIFITILLGFANILLDGKLPITIFVNITAIFQIASLIQYVNSYVVLKSQKKNDQLLNKEYLRIVKPILDNKEFKKRKEFPHHYNESVYDHVLRVSYDCFKIGKKKNLDYKALAIAGLLHDFYDKPWQSDFEKKPFFQKHGFTHAENARCNAKKYFPKLMNEKIESMISTHMFPLNKRIPKYKESWILTLVDKADSLDFLFHPLLMSKKIRKSTQKKGNRVSK